jgi:hypothetical protein
MVRRKQKNMMNTQPQLRAVEAQRRANDAKRWMSRQDDDDAQRMLPATMRTSYWRSQQHDAGEAVASRTTACWPWRKVRTRM